MSLPIGWVRTNSKIFVFVLTSTRHGFDQRLNFHGNFSGKLFLEVFLSACYLLLNNPESGFTRQTLIHQNLLYTQSTSRLMLLDPYFSILYDTNHLIVIDMDVRRITAWMILSCTSTSVSYSREHPNASLLVTPSNEVSHLLLWYGQPPKVVHPVVVTKKSQETVRISRNPSVQDSLWHPPCSVTPHNCILSLSYIFRIIRERPVSLKWKFSGAYPGSCEKT